MGTKKEVEIQELKSHREQVYEKAIDELIGGTGDPEFVHYRWKKLKRIKKAQKKGK